MGGLIPLRLGLSSDKRASMLDPSVVRPRRISLKVNKPTIVPVAQLQPDPIPELLISPKTKDEFTIVMEEVMKLYVKRAYKQCSARSIQILENIKDPYRVHPMYSIYLSFYAASSLEITARSLHINSSNKPVLFQQALKYYENAESYMEYAVFSADPTMVRVASRRRSSILSSARSSIDSVFSHASTATSACSSVGLSPTTSSCPATENKFSHLSCACSTISKSDLTPQPLRIEKKVSFNSEPSQTITGTSLDSSDLLDHFPSPAASPTPSQCAFDREESPNSIATFLLSRSLARYVAHLSDLHTQLHYHIASVKAQIEILHQQRKTRRSNLPNLFTNNLGSRPTAGVDKEEVRKSELEARIKRLREGGWERKRFDAERYKVLCEKALSELD